MIGTIPQVTQMGKMVQNEVWCTEITVPGVRTCVCKGLEQCCPPGVFFFFLKTTALTVCAPSPPCCDRTGGDPDQSGTVLHLQPRPAQPAGCLWCSTQQITGGTWLMLPQHTGITVFMWQVTSIMWILEWLVSHLLAMFEPTHLLSLHTLVFQLFFSLYLYI